MYMFLMGHYDGRVLAVGIEFFFSTVLFIMIEPRPRKTIAQIKHDDKIKNQGLSILMMMLVAVIIVVFASSCSGPRYGCGHGHPKQSWNKMVNRINRGY